MQSPPAEELIAITQHLLDAIGAGDWKTYVDLCDPTLTCFEPEARGQLVAGLEFHRYYFELERSGKPSRSTIASPHVRMLGPDAAAVCYARLVQCLDAAGDAHTLCFEETRLWQRQEGRWRHVHFHRSPVA